MTKISYASPLIAICPYCKNDVGTYCNTSAPCEANSHDSRWRAAQGIEIARLRDLLQEATEGQECFDHNTADAVDDEQVACSCGAAICPEQPEQCLLGRVDRALGHRVKGGCKA